MPPWGCGTPLWPNATAGLDLLNPLRVQSWTLNPFTHGDASAGALLMLRSVLMGKWV